MPSSTSRPTCLPVVCLISCCAVAAAAQAKNWPQWRGPTSNGISTETGIATEWSPMKNVLWKAPLPGQAGSTPVIWDDRIFLTSVDKDNLLLMCFSTEGKKLWQQTVGHGDRMVRGDEGNAASPSPLTDGKLVWAMMANGELGCYTVDGKEVWKLDLDEVYGPLSIAFGMTSTPVHDNDRLYLQLIHGDGDAKTDDARILCLNARTGAKNWIRKRVTGAYNENEHSYASPMLYDDGKLKLLITHGADFTIAYRLEDGQEFWRCGGLNPHDDPDRRYHPTLRFVASPAAVNGMVVIPTAKNGPIFAVRPDVPGDITDNPQAHLWKRMQNTPDVPSPLIHDGIVYLCRENGDLLCLDGKTGEQLYLARTHRMRHRASPVYADGKVYLSSRDGVISVVQAGRQFKLLARNKMEDSITSSPVISNGVLYLRTFGALWAIRELREK